MEQEQQDDQEVLEPSKCFKPVTVSDGSKCEHNFVQDFEDNGKIHLQCSKCWQGIWKKL